MYFQRSNLKRSSRYIKRHAILACVLMASIVCQTATKAYAFQPSQVTIVHSSDFGADEDANGDGWPDNWTRVFDREHPKYITVQTENRESINFVDLPQVRRSLAQWMLAIQQGRRPGDVVPEKIPIEIDRVLEHRLMNRCLQVEMNGGAVLLESKSFPVNRRFTYRLASEMQCDQLDDFVAQISVVGTKSDKSQIILARSKKQTGTTDWTPVRLNNIAINDSELISAHLRIEITPTNFQALHGALKIDSIRVYRQPKLSVRLTPPTQVVRAGESVRATCEVTGLDGEKSSVQFVVRDVEGKAVQQYSSPVETEVQRTDDAVPQVDSPIVGLCNMNLTFQSPGLYHVVVSLNDNNRHDFNQILQVAVLPEAEIFTPGPNRKFGIGIEGSGRSIEWSDTLRITTELGLGNLKIPIWFDASRGAEIDALANALDLMTNKEIRAVAVLDRPPPTLQNKFPGDTGSNIVNALDQPALWQPMLDPILQRVALHVREFQIGWDHEVSTLHDNKLLSILQNIRTKLNAYEPEAKITLPCNITDKEVTAQPSLINRFQLNAIPSLNAKEIESYNEQLTRLAENRWVTLEALNSRTYGDESAILDLTEKMLAITRSAFAVGYFNSNNNDEIFDEYGQPGMMYLPIRNLANWLRDCDQLEDIRLSNHHSAVLIHQSGKTHLLVLPAEEGAGTNRYWLGQDLLASDVWGRPFTLEVDEAATGKPIILPNCRWPVFIKNVNRSLIQWQSAVELSSKDIVMTTTSSVPLAVEVANPETNNAVGSIKIVAPNLIRDSSVDVRFNNSSKETKIAKADILLRSDVAEGEVPVKLIINVEAPESFSFELQRTLHVGLPGVRISSKTQVSKLGDLIIDVTIENQSSTPKSFDMLLFVQKGRANASRCYSSKTQ